MDSSQLLNQAGNAGSRQEFERLIGDLLDNLRNHPEEWENSSLEAFLTGLQGFVRDADGYYLNQKEESVDPNQPSWRLFAESLLAARVYE